MDLYKSIIIVIIVKILNCLRQWNYLQN